MVKMIMCYVAMGVIVVTYLTIGVIAAAAYEEFIEPLGSKEAELVILFWVIAIPWKIIKIAVIKIINWITGIFKG